MNESSEAYEVLRKENAALQEKVRTLEQAQMKVALSREALRTGEEMFSVSFLNSPIPQAITVLKDGRHVEVNEAFAKLMGVSREELIGNTSIDAGFMTAEQRVLFLKGHEEKGCVKNFEVPMKGKDGEWLYGLLNSSKITIGGEEYLLTMVTDITNRKRMETALLESEAKFKSFAEQSLVGVYLIQDGVFKYVNPLGAGIFGYSVEEYLNNMSFEKVVHPDDMAKTREQIRRRISGETEFVNYSFKGLKKDGQIVYVEIYGSSCLHKGKPAAAGTILDITERKQAESDREKLIMELKQALSQIKTLSGLLPICSACKKIRDDKGYWNQIEFYISEHSGAEFSHGICPECAKKLYPDYYKKMYPERQ